MGGGTKFLTVICVIVIFDQVSLLPGFENNLGVISCDGGSTASVPEGNIGESAHFPWLGVLRVHLHHGSELKIALTGLVLVKESHAIANSDDVSRIPKSVFQRDSKAMFLPKAGEPWLCALRDYVLHPEHEYATYNTIALVELEVEVDTKVPIQPICWPGNFYNTSNQLYALGYTDDNQLLEKIVYKLDYVKPSLCSEFYNKSGLSDYKTAPTHIQCGFAKNNKKDCEWENGMALVSNSTGKWHLIGISLRGPACSAPARFVDLFPYLPWVQAATDQEQILDYDDYRRQGRDRYGRRRQNEQAGVAPSSPIDPRFNNKYPKDYSSQKPFVVHRIDKDAITITSFDDVHEDPEGACSSAGKYLVYRDKLRIVDKLGKGGGASYRLSLYNMLVAGYSCVKIKVIKADRKTHAKLWYRFKLDPDDTFVHVGGPETPREILKTYNIFSPISQKEKLSAKGRPMWVPGPNLEPRNIEDTAEYEGIKNLNILIYIEYEGEGQMEVQVYANMQPRWLYHYNGSLRTPDSSGTEKPQRRSLPRKKLFTIKNLNKNEERSLSKNEAKKLRKKGDRKMLRNRTPFMNRRNRNRYGTTTKSLIEVVRVNVRDDEKTIREWNKKAKKRKDETNRRVHETLKSDFSKKNPYRLQKALLRIAERLSKATPLNPKSSAGN